MKIAYVLLILYIYTRVECSVIINEINAMGTGTGVNREKYKGRRGWFFVEKHDFIELWSEEPDFLLNGFKLLGVSVEKLNKPPTVELVVDLWDQKTDENGFFVVGGPSVKEANLKVSEQTKKIIMYRDMFNKQPSQLRMSNFLLNGWSGPKAIVLIYKKNERFKDFTIKETSTFITIDDTVLNIIQDNLVDMVVYAENAKVERCNIFEQIQPRFVNINYMLREFDRGDRDNSLNRCSIETTGCIPEQFKLGTPSPRAENDCSGAFFTFTSEASELIEPVLSVPLPENEIFEIEEHGQCSTSMGGSFYKNLKEHTVSRVIDDVIETARKEADSCTASSSNPYGGNIRDEVSRANKRKRSMSEEEDFSEELEWETTKYFE